MARRCASLSGLCPLTGSRHGRNVRLDAGRAQNAGQKLAKVPKRGTEFTDLGGFVVDMSEEQKLRDESSVILGGDDWNQEHWDRFLQRLMASLISSTKASNRVGGAPSSLEFISSSIFKEQSRRISTKIVRLMLALGRHIRGAKADTEVAAVDALPDDLTNTVLYEHIVDMIDYLLDGADSLLSEEGTHSSSSSTTTSSINASAGLQAAKLVLAVDKRRLLLSNILDISKPQLKFKIQMDNSRDQPFKPILRTKPHAVAPLNFSRLLRSRTAEQSAEANPAVEVQLNKHSHSTDGGCRVLALPDTYYGHPYEAELRALTYQEDQLRPPAVNNEDNDDDDITATRNCPPPLVGTPGLPDAYPMELVETREALERCVADLGLRNEVAVDLEHHDHRSFQGIVCLMQISTRMKDYIIDTLLLRESMDLLGDIFANPQITKVFHGCDKDILWLQRDFGLYVVNCFDTFQGAKLLGFSALSLAHLLRHYCGVEADKQHQLADWRQRPLPLHLMRYAQEDTHYLLYVYDRIRADLWTSLGRDGVVAALDTSRRSCLQRYDKEPFWSLGYRKLFRSDSRHVPSASSLTEREEAVIAALFNWRDAKARALDESPEYVMSNAEMLRLGKAAPVSDTAARASGPLSRVVEKYLSEVVAVVIHATTVGPMAVSVEADSVVGKDSIASTSKKSSGHVFEPDNGGSLRSGVTGIAAAQSLAFHLSGQGTALATEIAGAGASVGAAYGRALRTPTRELSDGSPVVIDGDDDGGIDRGNGMGCGGTIAVFTPVVSGAAVLSPDTHSKGGTTGAFTPNIAAGSSSSQAASLDAGLSRSAASTSSPTSGAGYHRPSTLPSPIMQAEEIYRRAGWITPTAFDRPLGSPNGSGLGSGGGGSEGGGGGGGGSDALGGDANDCHLEHRQAAALPRPMDPPVRPLRSTSPPKWTSEKDVVAAAAAKTTTGTPSHVASTKSEHESSDVAGRGPYPNEEALPVAPPKSRNGNGATLPLGGDGVVVDASVESVPKSFAEIYEISNRNRKRNKERKRVRDGEDGEDSSATGRSQDSVGYAVGVVAATVDGDDAAVAATATTSTSATIVKNTASTSSNIQRLSRSLDAPIFDESVYFDARAVGNSDGAISKGKLHASSCHSSTKDSRDDRSAMDGGVSSSSGIDEESSKNAATLGFVGSIGWLDGTEASDSGLRQGYMGSEAAGASLPTQRSQVAGTLGSAGSSSAFRYDSYYDAKSGMGALGSTDKSTTRRAGGGGGGGGRGSGRAGKTVSGTGGGSQLNNPYLRR